MDSKFDATESLVRAVYPENQRPDFWKNGRLSSAALKDKKGLSVTRTYDRSLKDTVEWMASKFKGVMVAITVCDCTKVQAYVKIAHRKTIHIIPRFMEVEKWLS